ncbi:MAG: DUF1841 family protein [Proteobacteria bacterium]|nr:DUF1841 family protein [Pseudomonadota bacterium]MDA1063373.1 DUF1841 family protein [Pseudomonadota bacterium]
MIFGQDRGELRKMYADAWQKHCSAVPLSPLEAQIAAVVAVHPEYHASVSGDLEADFTIEDGSTNPFLHMGLHMGIREQVAIDRPAGVAAVFRQLTARLGDSHQAEHRMLDCLAETLWDAQRRQAPPDEAAYLERLRTL